MPIIEGVTKMIQVSGAQTAGTDEVQTITVTGTPTGGTFRLSFQGFVTGEIAFDADAAAVDAALEALPSIGTGNVTCAGGPLPGDAVTVTFAGTLVKKALPLLVVAHNSLTGGTTPTVTIAETTPGVDAALRGLPKGVMVMETSTGKLYVNSGTAYAPALTLIGAQT